MTRNEFRSVAMRIVLSSFFLAALAGTSAAGALPAGRLAPVASGFGRSGDAMGSAVALLGDTMLVGSPNAAPDAISASGAVQVFRNGGSGWEREAVLGSGLAPQGAGFGSEVSLGGDTAAIGSGRNPGRTFVFVRDGSAWTLTDTIDYGNRPSLSGDTLAVGGTTGVRVYVQQGGAWVQQQEFETDGAASGEIVFGVRVAGDTLAFLGAYYASVSGVNLYVYHRDNGVWTRDTRSFTGDFAFDQPPPCLAISGDSIIVGMSTSAEVFVRGDGSWPLQQTLDAGVPWTTVDSVAIDGDRAIVGSASDTVLANSSQGSAYIFERTGSTWDRVSRPYDANGNANARFGQSVAISSDSALVGAPGTIVGGIDTGSALPVAIGDGTWSAETRLDEGESHANEGFGGSLAISGATLVASARGAMADTPGASGVMYIFEAIGSEWIQKARLAPPSPQHYSFPASVAIDGDTIAAGSDNDNDGNPSEYGAVYVYRRDGDDWAIEQRISSGAVRPSFGAAVALEGDLLAVGDPGRLNGPDPSGRVRTFTRSGSVWSEDSLIQPQESEDGDTFGAVLALAGSTLAVGAPTVNVEIESFAGAAYIFENVGGVWQQQARLVAPSPLQAMQFGYSVALAADTLIVGVSRVTHHDGAFVFVRDGDSWTLQATLSAPAITTGGITSVALSADGSTALVGEADTIGTSPGHAVVFVRDGSTWAFAHVLHGNTASADGFGAAVTFDGTDAVVGAPMEASTGSVYVVPLGDEVFSDGFD